MTGVASSSFKQNYKESFMETQNLADCHYLYTQKLSSISPHRSMVFVISASGFRSTANVKMDPCCQEFDMFLPDDIWFWSDDSGKLAVLGIFVSTHGLWQNAITDINCVLDNEGCPPCMVETCRVWAIVSFIGRADIQREGMNGSLLQD